MERRGRLYGCPVELTLDLLGAVILSRLKQARLRDVADRKSVV